VLTINAKKYWLVILTSFLFLTVGFSIITYELNLLDYSEHHFYQLKELIDTKIESIDAKVYEYDSIKEFTRTTGAPFFISAFTNKQGIHIQSRHLLGDRFRPAVVHELTHYTLQFQYPLPSWFEEGLVCIVTQEFSEVTDIIAMKNVEEYDIRKANNNWELISYCLGCIKKVQAVLSSESSNQAIP